MDFSAHWHPTKIIRRPEVLAVNGQSRSTLYQHIAAGLWTRPVKISARSVGWPSDEVSALIEARIGGFTDPEIRELVRQLHSARGAQEHHS